MLIETARLLLRPPRLTDAPPLFDFLGARRRCSAQHRRRHYVTAGAISPHISVNAGASAALPDDLIGGEILVPYNYGVRREIGRCASIAQVPCAPRSGESSLQGEVRQRLPSTGHMEHFRDIVLTTSSRFFSRKCLRETGNSFTTTH